jgi:pre-mRNA-splicing factor 38A
MPSKTTHSASATALLDNRGYRGPLIRGENPAHLFDAGTRERVVKSLYWNERCWGLNEASLCDRAAELTCVGGTYGVGGRPAPFLCLAFKMCQLVPDRDVVLAYLNWEDQGDDDEEEEESGEKKPQDRGDEDPPMGRGGHFKYLRALAAFYIRLAWEPVDIFTTLEPLLGDYRKLRRRVGDGFTLTHVDAFVDDLLTKERVCSTSLWRLPSRLVLEGLDLLAPRVSPLGEDEIEEAEDEEMLEGEDGVVEERSDEGSDERSEGETDGSERGRYDSGD